MRLMARYRYKITGTFDVDLEKHSPGAAVLAAIPDLPVGDEYTLDLLADDVKALQVQVTIATGVFLSELPRAVPTLVMGTIDARVEPDEDSL